MGSLTYDRFTVQFDDRMLAHLEIVIIRKLRCGESLLLSWQNAAGAGGGRGSIWLNPAIPLYFKFATEMRPAIEPLWIAELTRSANSAQGLIVTGGVHALSTPAKLVRRP
jgi:hypothetical protein